MNTRAKLFEFAFSGVSLLAISSLSSASARIVCNEDGDCWHVQNEYVYPPSVHLEVHPDNWRWKDSDHFVWKEHQGRGYWHGGQWEAF